MKIGQYAQGKNLTAVERCALRMLRTFSMKLTLSFIRKKKVFDTQCQLQKQMSYMFEFHLTHTLLEKN